MLLTQHHVLQLDALGLGHHLKLLPPSDSTPSSSFTAELAALLEMASGDRVE